MTIYNINFSIGWANSGVEYAQLYRAELLRNQREPIKFVFLDLILKENIQTLTENLGFKNQEIIWIYQYFTDVKISKTTYTIQKLLKTIGFPVTHIENKGKIKRLYIDGNRKDYITCYLKDEEKELVDRAEFVSKGKLIRKDFYSYVRTFSEYYAPTEGKAKVYMRQFYNEDGSIAYSEYIENNNSMFVFKDEVLYSKQELVAYFFTKLNLTEKDLLLIDRSTRLAQAMIQYKGKASLGIIIHAEHYSKKASNPEHILWNNHYEYQFKNSDEIDFFLTATDTQNKLLSEQFKHYYQKTPKIITIPVGSIKSLKYSSNRKPYSIITASRLAKEKHIDWLIRAVVKARTNLRDLTFDIYGEGGEAKHLKELIKTLDADSYIKLKGHVDLEEVYSQYELFLSASTSEGFGLTLMEAVGSGLGIIGFDVNYGNPTFIGNENNGYIIPFDIEKDTIDKITDRQAEKIIQYFSKDLKKVQAHSYSIAEKYQFENIQKKWKNLINEVLYD